MTKEQANRLLDEVKDGNSYLSVKRITEALWLTGDAVRPLPIHSRPFSEDGINEWLESTRMAQGERVGDSPDRHLEEYQQGLNRHHESKN
jgi:pyruvate-formate lyase-activating enzyme